jgi:hypothetical protein
VDAQVTAHAIGDALLITAAVGELALLYWLLGQKSYWKRIARLHENRMLDARERAGNLERALDALRRALARIERDDEPTA